MYQHQMISSGVVLKHVYSWLHLHASIPPCLCILCTGDQNAPLTEEPAISSEGT